MPREPQILACSGLLYPPADYPKAWNGSQIWQAMQLSGARNPKVCVIATATGDPQAHIAGWTDLAQSLGAVTSHLALFTQPNVPDVRAHLLAQDVIFVGGGSVVNLLAVWRAHRLDEIMRECWEAGVVLAGQSAGSVCWHLGGATDSFSDALDPITNGLGFLPYSNGVHDDLGDQPRRERYRDLVASGELPAGYATEDGVGLHYVGTEFQGAFSVWPGQRAWHVAPDREAGYAETAIEPRQWNPPR
ncbi:MAG: Type 1 glutamine amidotransferase-like domain-containing protein [Trebonia sp.]